MSESHLTSVIVVTWNTSELTTSCLRSIFDKNGGVPLDVIVVDNASTDSTRDEVARSFPGAHVIANERNVGFARAVNQALRVARGDPIVLVNSDTVLVSEGSLARIGAFLERNPRVGIVGVKLLSKNGRVQSLGRPFLSLKTLVASQIFFSSASAFARKSRPAAGAEAIAVDCVDGAFLAIRRDVVSRIGPMNERYFMFAEDTEWCLAARREGWEVAVLPEVEVLHLHGQSALKDFARALVVNAVSVSRFVGATRGAAEGRTAFCVIALGMLLRIPVNLVRDPARSLAYAKGFRRCAAMLPRLGAIIEGDEDVS